MKQPVLCCCFPCRRLRLVNLRVSLLLLLLTATAASSQQQQQKQSVTPATGVPPRHVCERISGCNACVRGTRKAVICTRCKAGAVLAGGQCLCPPGFGAHGSPNTVRGSSDSNPTTATNKNKKGTLSTVACVPCMTNAFAEGNNAIRSARCTKCVAGTTSAQGASACTVPAGSFYDPGARAVLECPGNPLDSRSGDLR